MKNMKISIIIPNYNNSKFIDKCLKSVLKQTYSNFEIIIIDDGSTDDSVEVIKKYVDNEKIKLIVQPNQNGAVARNNGLINSTGEYILFLDSDDELFDENIIKTMIDNIKDNDLLIFDYIKINEKNEKIGEYHNVEHLLDLNDNYKYLNVSPVPSNKLFSKKIILQNNIYFSNVRIGQDLNFFLKYLLCAKKINIISEYAYKYRILSSGISKNVNYNILDIYNCFEEILKFYKIHNLKYIFDKYIRSIAIEHFYFQLSKIEKFKDKRIRRAFIRMFNIFYIQYRKECTYRDKFYKKYKNKFILKKLLLLFNLDKIYRGRTK